MDKKYVVIKAKDEGMAAIVTMTFNAMVKCNEHDIDYRKLLQDIGKDYGGWYSTLTKKKVAPQEVKDGLYLYLILLERYRKTPPDLLRDLVDLIVEKFLYFYECEDPEQANKDINDSLRELAVRLQLAVDDGR